MKLETDHVVGNYRVVRPLGVGGMGSVYEVEHVRLGVRYAMKVFAAEGKDAAFLRKRFFAEGKILARLDHPRIVRVYDMDVTDGFAWFTMDYIEGPSGKPQTLADLPTSGATSEAKVSGWYDDVREALDVVHAAGIVHRDVKLENILIGRDGRAVLSDFGVSRIIDDDLRRKLEVTRTMVAKDADMKLVVGTAAYLAPEIRSGGEPTAATDFYALGVAFFRLITGLWYEPGPHAFDLLEPFDRWWRQILPVLLSADPANRRALPFAKIRCGQKSGLWWRCLLSAALASVVTATVFLLMFANHEEIRDAEPCENHSNQGENVRVEDVFSIPDSIK